MLAHDWLVRAVSCSPALPALGLVSLGARDAASQPQTLWNLQREGAVGGSTYVSSVGSLLETLSALTPLI